ncbi:MAG: ribonuclease P protein component [Proteobacteria bacterium]|nr:ribonuclease P protein component [Pseudomonadota bacterium]
MLLPISHRFPKAHRLLTRGEFVAVQEEGHKVTSRFFVGLIQADAKQTHARLGITATRRFGNAVARNRAKRIIREAFRTHRLQIPRGYRIVVLPRIALKRATTDEAWADLERLNVRIQRALHNEAI